jgi:hypothetical protein
MSNTIEVKRRKVFIVGDMTFSSMLKARDYLKEYPYEYKGKRYSSKTQIKYLIDKEKRYELDEVFKKYAAVDIEFFNKRYVDNYYGNKLIEVLSNADFHKDSLRIVEKYNKLIGLYDV